MTNFLNQWCFFTVAVMKGRAMTDEGKYLLRLYITGHTPRSERAIQNLRKICAEELDRHYEMAVIDILEHPQLAEDEKILATPTLIKSLPLPLRRIIGDLSDREKILLRLGLLPSDEEQEKTSAVQNDFRGRLSSL